MKTYSKKILIIGMLDSIHTSRWIERIVDSSYEIHIFPSRVHRRVHPELINILQNHPNVTLIGQFPIKKIAPYIDFIKRKISFKSQDLLSLNLKNYLKSNNYSHVHALEIQHAGYQLLKVKPEINNALEVICTNWGSDIYYYSEFEEHQPRIREVLKLSTAYSAECERDYDLAKHFGFTGRMLPLIPNSFKLDESILDVSDASNRTQIIVKCYGGIFGLGATLIEVMRKILDSNLTPNVLFYSVTDELVKDIKTLKNKFPDRVKMVLLRNPMSSAEIAMEFRGSRVYVGASKSDGISTSFLEAMNFGAFPIQTNTSCAEDWMHKGCIGKSVEPNEQSIFDAISQTYEDDILIEKAARVNLGILRSETGNGKLNQIARSFYDLTD
jgi:hypothetical protein